MKPTWNDRYIKVGNNNERIVIRIQNLDIKCKKSKLKLLRSSTE